LQAVSKAFTKEDDDAGTALPPGAGFSVATAPFRITAQGLAILAESPDERVRALLPVAQLITAPESPATQATLGVTVHVRDEHGAERAYLLVSSEEQTLTGQGCSVQSPLGRALLGAQVGEVREFATPKGSGELEVLRLS
jgi:transcription elongation GreA/GreB family factor